VDVESAGYRTTSEGVGSAGEETWTIKAHDKGRAVPHWKYWRPWADESTVIDRFEITVEVQAT